MLLTVSTQTCIGKVLILDQEVIIIAMQTMEMVSGVLSTTTLKATNIQWLLPFIHVTMFRQTTTTGVMVEVAKQML